MENNTKDRIYQIIFAGIISILAIMCLASDAYISLAIGVAALIFLSKRVWQSAFANLHLNLRFPVAFFACMIMLFGSMNGFDQEQKKSDKEKEEAEKLKYKEAFDMLSEEQQDSVLNEKKRIESQAYLKKEAERAFGTNGTSYQLMQYVKKRMNDPSSFDHESSSYIILPDSTVVVNMQYRGKNAFGALILTSTKARCKLNGDVIEIID